MPRQHGYAAPARHGRSDERHAPCSCPECEVVLPSGLRFSYSLGMLQSQGWHVHPPKRTARDAQTILLKTSLPLPSCLRRQ